MISTPIGPWVMAFSRRSAEASWKTTSATNARSSEPVGVQDGTAERVDQCGECGTARCGDVVGHVVGVHHA